MGKIADGSLLVAVLAPTAHDSEVAVEVLKHAKIDAVACANIEDLCGKIREGILGTVIISEEAIRQESVTILQDELEKQPKWSDLPVILLTNADVVRASEVFSRAGNISLLERPFSQLTLIRAVQVALRSRTKQYEVRSLLERLSRAKEDSERANLSKSQFLANMSHEIRTPIGAIMGFIDIVKNSGELSKENSNYMGIVDRNSRQLLTIIDDILDISKVEAGKLTVEKIEMDLSTFLLDIKSSKALAASEKGVGFSVELRTPIPATIESDPVRLRQVLSNLISNAIKFTDKGSVKVIISYNEPTLRFDVVDTGIGLTAQQASKLFQPFTQADSSTTRRFGGTGLGLSLSLRLSQLLGGTLEMTQSTPEFGSTFTFQMPAPLFSARRLISSLSDTPSARPEKKVVDTRASLRGLRLLVVEDSPDNQTLIKTYLRNTECLIEIENDGAAGVQYAMTREPDVILMDIQMPVMDGHEATRTLRARGYKGPIIALTAHAMQEEKDRCFASGFSGYLTKPIQKSELILALERFVPGGELH